VGKIAEELEKIIEIHKIFYDGEVRGADLARNIELYILDAKPKLYDLNSGCAPQDRDRHWGFGKALKEWEDNLKEVGNG